MFGPGRIRQTNPGHPILVVEGASDVQIRDLTLMRPAGKTDTQSEGVLGINCANLVVENVRVLDNRTRTAAIELRDCYASQIRNCLVRNYQCVSEDDRTMDVDSGYAFPCLVGTGIVLKDGHLSLRVLIDRTSIEAFINGGEVDASGIFFPDMADPTLSLTVEGGPVRIHRLVVHELRSTWSAAAAPR